jgi:hypothetical protein
MGGHRRDHRGLMLAWRRVGRGQNSSAKQVVGVPESPRALAACLDEAVSAWQRARGR